MQKRLQAGRGTYVTGVDDDNALLALLGKRSAGQSALAGTHQGLRRANSDRTLGNRSGNPPAAGPQRRGPVVHGRKGSSSSGGSADSGGSFGSLHSAPDLSLQRRGRGAEGAGGKRPVPPGEQQRGRGGAQNNLYMNGNGIASAKTQGGRQQPAPQPPSARRPWYPPGPPLTTTGTYERARQLAKTSNRWLLVYVYSEGDEEAQRLNEETWTDPLVQDIVRGSYVFWAGSSSEDDGCRCCTMNRLKRVPATFLLDPYSGKIASVIYGFVSAVSLGRTLTNFGQKQPSAPRQAGDRQASGGTARRPLPESPPASPTVTGRGRSEVRSPVATSPNRGGKSPHRSLDDLSVPGSSTVRYEQTGGGTFEYRVVPSSEMPSQMEMLRAIFGEHATHMPQGEYGKDWGGKRKRGKRLPKQTAPPQAATANTEVPRETSLKVRADGKLYPSTFPAGAPISELFDHCFEVVPQADARAFTLKHISTSIRDLAEEEEVTILEAGLDKKTVILSWLD